MSTLLYRPRHVLCLGTIVTLLHGCATESHRSLYRAPAIPNVVDGVVFEPGNWQPHLPAGERGSSWGNHRAVVEVTHTDADAVFVTIPWRRHDPNPAARSVVVVDANTNQLVANATALRVERESGDVVFQPNRGSTTYHVYYMPWESTGGYYPQITYPVITQVTDRTWETRVHATTSELAHARTTKIQSVDAFHSFFPMEVIANRAEHSRFMASATNGWALTAEHRDYPVRMQKFIPQHWASRDGTNRFSSNVLPGEYFTMQLAIVAGDISLDDIEVTFEGFPGWSDRITCFGCGGIDEQGQRFTKALAVPANTVHPIWIGFDVPEAQRRGPVTGTATITTRSHGNKSVQIDLEVGAGRAINHGFDTPELMTRLAWLNSTTGTDPNFIIDPFQPVQVTGQTLSILGRTVHLAENGLPREIASFFSPELTHLVDTPDPILQEQVRLDVIVSGVPERMTASDYRVFQTSPGRAEWTTTNRSDRFTARVEGALEYDGMLEFRISLSALQDVAVDDIRLPVILETDAAKYMLGLGRRGGKRPQTVDWKWQVQNHQEGVWLGAVHKGLQYVLRDDNYKRPLNTNFYQNQPLVMPVSWENTGNGGIRISTSPRGVTALNYSGPRRMAAGDSLQFNVRFLITPFKPIDTRQHFRTRFVHKYVPVDSVLSWGGTVVNIHHANEINPYINYPFFNLDKQTAYIEEAHEKGIKVKLYNTIRELTYKAHELFALRSLGDEILNDGDGGGHSWMQEHLITDYHSAWHAWSVDDAAILNKGTSRWTNYYIEGLSWLAEHQHIDGLYLDDIAFSRATVKRMISVLHQHRGNDVVIDLHSANQFNPRDGHINSAMLYMEHFPFISRLWFGEYFEYDRDEDYWMTEISGLPFGLMGEMLQDGGHPYRGLLYGMTSRMYGDVDPRPVWRLMNDFGIDASRMLGYWLDDAPVTTNHPRILATTYVKPDGVLIALASWASTNEIVDVVVDDSILNPTWRAFVPAVSGLQSESDVDLTRVRVPANQGLFIRIGPHEGVR